MSDGTEDSIGLTGSFGRWKSINDVATIKTQVMNLCVPDTDVVRSRLSI